LGKPAFSCIGFEPRKAGLSPNCGNCKHYNGKTCLIKAELDDLYEESRSFEAFDRMMRSNKGIKLD